jgi:glutamine cyclotransferase
MILMDKSLSTGLRFCTSVFFTALLCACGSEEKKAETGDDLLSQRAAFEISAFSNGLTWGDTLSFSALQTDSARKFDSVQLFLDNVKMQTLRPSALQFSIGSTSLSVGTHFFRLAGFDGGRETGSGSASFRLLSDLQPESLAFEVLKTFPHNPASFTQGLEWHEGKLFEGTGLNGKSAVMEVNLSSGESMKKTALSQEHFGEGISILNGKLYQLTWQSHRAFVYSLPDLKQEGSFGYPTEGWGLCDLKGELVMSDGSEKLYFLNPTDFSLIRTVQVWDKKNAITELNELEAVDGLIYANKYQTDTIVQIDPANGKVLAYANLSGLLKNEDRKGNEDVLNGIAWNPAEKLFYLTGKNWPKLFAGKFTSRKSI